LRTQFLHLRKRKNWLSWNCLSDVLYRRIALRTKNLPSARLKDDFDEVDEAMFEGVEGPCVPIFCISGIKKLTFKKPLKLCFK
jgi:hypothetical protein